MKGAVQLQRHMGSTSAIPYLLLLIAIYEVAALLTKWMWMVFATISYCFYVQKEMDTNRYKFWVGVIWSPPLLYTLCVGLHVCNNIHQGLV